MRRPPRGQTASETNGTSEAALPAGAHPTEAAQPSKRGAEPGLHLVATPIGNLGDITLRAIDVLRQVDLIACEDTRVSVKLLSRLGIDTRRVPYHEHNAATMRPRLLERLKSGERIALISDAGTPLVSDPGFKLVREALDLGIPVHVLPGPSAPLAALLLSGLPCDRFLFAGFLPPRQAARRTELSALASVPATLLFFESAQRLGASLADMAAVLGDRDAAVARELTKLHEEVVRGHLAELAERYAGAPPKGEIMVVVAPPGPAEPAVGELDERLRAALGSATVRDAAAQVAAELGLPRRKVYARALEIAEELG